MSIIDEIKENKTKEILKNIKKFNSNDPQQVELLFTTLNKIEGSKDFSYEEYENILRLIKTEQRCEDNWDCIVWGRKHLKQKLKDRGDDIPTGL